MKLRITHSWGADFGVTFAFGFVFNLGEVVILIGPLTIKVERGE